jgi:hypothetical protein
VDELTPDQTEAVRRLLAAARHGEPIPADLAARLDGVLAELVAERGEAGEAPPERAPATVIPLRRRRWAQVLVAAAAVTVLGYATTTVLDNSSGDADSTAEDAPAAVEAGGQESGPTESGADTGVPSRVPSPMSNQALRDALSGLDVTQLTSLSSGRSLAQDLDQLLLETKAAELGARYSTKVSATCGPIYAVDGATRYVALYRRHVALVLAYPVTDGARRVDVYDCESATPRRAAETVTLTGE